MELLLVIASASVNSPKILFWNETGLIKENSMDELQSIRSLKKIREDILVGISNNILKVWNLNQNLNVLFLKTENLIDNGLFIKLINSTHYVVATLMDILIYDIDTNSLKDKLQDG